MSATRVIEVFRFLFDFEVLFAGFFREFAAVLTKRGRLDFCLLQLWVSRGPEEHDDETLDPSKGEFVLVASCSLWEFETI